MPGHELSQNSSSRQARNAEPRMPSSSAPARLPVMHRHRVPSDLFLAQPSAEVDPNPADLARLPCSSSAAPEVDTRSAARQPANHVFVSLPVPYTQPNRLLRDHRHSQADLFETRYRPSQGGVVSDGVLDSRSRRLAIVERHLAPFGRTGENESMWRWQRGGTRGLERDPGSWECFQCGERVDRGCRYCMYCQR